MNYFRFGKNSPVARFSKKEDLRRGSKYSAHPDEEFIRELRRTRSDHTNPHDGSLNKVFLESILYQNSLQSCLIHLGSTRSLYHLIDVI